MGNVVQFSKPLDALFGLSINGAIGRGGTEIVAQFRGNMRLFIEIN